MNRDQGLTARVRKAALDLGREQQTFGAADLAARVAMTPAEKKNVGRYVLRDLLKKGELERAGRGQYRWKAAHPLPNLQEVMWRVLRARKVVTAADLIELAGATLEYARDFLYRLKRQGVVQIIDGGQIGELIKFRLINDPGPEMPRDGANAEKCRAWREKKKQALDALDAVFVAVAEARMAVSELEEG